MAGLERFLSAQERQYLTALAEIKAGQKRSHWMWYIFPQIQGLGQSPTSQAYAIRDIDEARAFLDHPILRSRLIEICEALLALPSRDAGHIFGWPDELKLRSSMTLFALADSHLGIFQQVLDKFFHGKMDQRTIAILQTQQH